MSTIRNSPITKGLISLHAETLTQSRHLAVLDLKNGSATVSEREAALEAAQRAGVTTLQYLRAHLLLEAGIREGRGTSDDDY
jgi:hypothetical protein